jgi:hypothetical protein
VLPSAGARDRWRAARNGASAVIGALGGCGVAIDFGWTWHFGSSGFWKSDHGTTRARQCAFRAEA